MSLTASVLTHFSQRLRPCKIPDLGLDKRVLKVTLPGLFFGRYLAVAGMSWQMC